MSTTRAPSALRTWAVGLVPDRGPARRLALITLIPAVGFGMFLGSSAIFFQRVVGLSATQVGIGLSIAGFCGLLSTVPVGKLADRHEPRLLLAVNYVLTGLLYLTYGWVDGFVSFVLVASLISMGETSAFPLRMALAHQLFGAAEQVRVVAQLRTILNLGFLPGTALAAVALSFGSQAGFLAVVILTGVTRCAGAVLVWRLLPATGRPDASGTTSRVSRAGLRDIRFTMLTVLNGILELHQPILTVALPLWISTRLQDQTGLAPILVGVNTVLVILFQVHLSRRATTVRGAAVSLRRAGCLLAASCVVLAVSQDMSIVHTAALIVVGTVVLGFGELSQAAGSWGVSLLLPPPGKQGEYQGVFALGQGIQQAGPFLVTLLTIGPGAPGWLALAALFLVAGVLCVSLTASVERRNALEPVPQP